MPVGAIFNAGVEGFNRAQQDVEQATANINRATIERQDQQQTQQGRQLQGANANEAVTAPVSQAPRVDEELVNLKVAEFNAKANTESIRTADEVLGTIIDIRA
ncbi:hypothetical protein CWC31_03535 [Pseudoalteromonas ruthenica]|uniref:hypothetical protein n=1 Tax=Pseudoalteromonas ruthenica TaxID=151081 RepID=UPI001109E9E4|nr:hypothetical protein [Pseudoalteromonas ruthenica]TLX52233.1 hypothetical protein CWC31_03535 [Pseudoalteromonas ruthenica]